MPWMTENSHEYNPNRSKLKDKAILGRARESLDDDNFIYLIDTLEECLKKYLDRDIEIGIALDVLEVLKVTNHYADAALLGAYEIKREIELGRISPIDGVITRDLINKFTPSLFNMSDYIDDSSYLKSAKTDIITEEEIIGLKSCLYNYSANALMDEKSAKRFQEFISENPDLVVDCDMEFNIFFNLLDALYAKVDDHIAASIMATEINREIAIKRIKPESTALIHYLVMNFAPETFINKAYVTTNHNANDKIDIKSLKLNSKEENNE